MDESKSLSVSELRKKFEGNNKAQTNTYNRATSSSVTSGPVSSSLKSATVGDSSGVVSKQTTDQLKESSLNNKYVVNDNETAALSIKDRMKMFDRPRATTEAVSPLKTAKTMPIETKVKIDIKEDVEAINHEKIDTHDASKQVTDEPLMNTFSAKEIQDKIKPQSSQDLQVEKQNKSDEVINEAEKPKQQYRNSVLENRSEFAARMNDLIGGKNVKVKSPEDQPIQIKDKKEVNNSDDAYMDVLLSKPKSNPAKRQSKLVFLDE